MTSTTQTIGSYQIISELGRGGMAIVYKVFDPAAKRYLALKVLPANLMHDQAFIARFRREADIAKNLNHPNIVQIYEVSQKEPYYLAMQFVEGETLASLIRREGKMSPARIASIIKEIAGALDYAHARGVVHRDIKPSNIMLDGLGRAFLADFGIARATEATRLTQTGSMIGTPEYMSPEQGQGKSTDARSDTYSLGVVAYEMLTAQVPFHADTPLGTLHQHVYSPPPRLNKLNLGLPPSVEPVVLKALAKDPAQRYASASEFAQVLEAALIGEAVSVEAPTESSTRLIEAPTRARSSLIWAGGAAGIALILIALGVFYFLNQRNALAVALASPTSNIIFTPTQQSAAISQVQTATPIATATATRISFTPTPVPTATRIPPQKALTSDQQFQVVAINDLVNGNTSVIFDTRSRFRAISSAAFSRDGKRILVSHCYANSTTDHGHSIAIIDADGSNLVSIAGSGRLNSPEASCLSLGSAIWSPDGKMVAFRRGLAGSFGVFLMNADGTGTRRLESSDISDYPLYWSTNNKWILAVSATDSLVWALSLEGNERKPLHQIGGIEVFEQRIYPWELISVPGCNLPDKWHEVLIGPFWFCQ